MTTSHRLRTSAGAAALTAALVLVPTAAFADDAPAASTAASTADTSAPVAADGTPAADVPAAASSDAPAPAAPADAPAPATAPTAAPGNTAVGQRPVPSAAAIPTATAQPTAAAPAPDSSAPSTQGAGTVVVVAPEVEPNVEVYPGAAHPGSTFSVWVEGFTAGDAVSTRVDGDAVSTDDVFTVYPGQLPFVFDTSGAAYFDVEVPADLPLGTLTVTVSDAHGTTSSTEVAVTDPIPAPVVVAPVGATAGIVTVSGTGGLPGQAAVVVVGQPDDVEEGFGFGFSSSSSDSSSDAADAPADATSDTSVEEAGADLSSLVTTAEQAEAAPDEDFFDREPVEWSAADGPATALVPIAADGTFSARFVLPAGDFGTTAVVIDTETSDTSLAAAVAPFTVSAAAAAAPVVTPAGPAGVPANTVVATRAGSLAYTGTESALPAGIAALALLLGGVLATTARLRRRA